MIDSAEDIEPSIEAFQTTEVFLPALTGLAHHMGPIQSDSRYYQRTTNTYSANSYRRGTYQVYDLVKRWKQILAKRTELRVDGGAA
jgi:hypothetical protein